MQSFAMQANEEIAMGGRAAELAGSALHLLLVEEDTAVLQLCFSIGAQMAFVVHTAGTLGEAREILRRQTVDAILLDLKLSDGEGLSLLGEIKSLRPNVPVVVMTAFGTVSSAVEAMRVGAEDYLTKPFSVEDLRAVLERIQLGLQKDAEVRRLRERLRAVNVASGLIGGSPEMQKMLRILSKVAFTTHPVLIVGESGTGKESVARAIHENGPNAAKPFVMVDCSSRVLAPVESELFGYVKGAFAGADRSKDGLLVAAGCGTVFLDEVGEMPLELQTKLLRALQEREVRPVGATAAVPIRARILAATNRDLPVLVEQGKFRKDLYFRLNVVNMRIPPLRNRKEDIVPLAAHFLHRIQQRKGMSYTFSDEVLRVMTEYEWPGNVRELENAIERVCTMSSGPLLQLMDMPTSLQEFRNHRQHRGLSMSAEPGIISIAELEKQAILKTIRQLHGDKLKAAKLLGIGKTTLYRKLKEYGIGYRDVSA